MSTEMNNEQTEDNRRRVFPNRGGQELLGISRAAFWVGLAMPVIAHAIVEFEVETTALHLPIHLAGVAGIIVTWGLAYITRRDIPAEERARRIWRQHTRRHTMLNIRKGSMKEQVGGSAKSIRHWFTEGPEGMTRIGWLVRTKPMQFFTDSGVGIDPEKDRPQEYSHAIRPFHNSPAIETEDGAVIGAIRVTPAAMAVPDQHTWEDSVDRLANVIDSSVSYRTQFTSKMRAVDYTERIAQYEVREEEYLSKLQHKHGSIANAYSKVGWTMADSEIDEEDLGWMIAAELCEERQQVLDIYDQTTLKRDFYVTIKVTPEDIVRPEHIDRESGGIHTVPYVGDWYSKYQLKKLRKEGDHLPAMIDRVERALSSFQKELRSIKQVNSRVISSTEFSVAISDHFHAANMYATADYEDIIRVSPTPETSDDSMYGVSYDHLRTMPDEVLGGPSPDAPGAGAPPAAADGGTVAESSDSEDSETFFDRVQAINDHPIADVVTTPEELEEHYREKISARRMDTENDEWLIIDKAAYSKTFSIRDWPKIPKMGILEPIIKTEEPGVAVNMANHIYPVDQHKETQKLDRAEREARDNIEKSEKGTVRKYLDSFKYRYISDHEAAVEMQEANRESPFDLFRSNTHIELRSADPKAIQNVISEINSSLDDEGARIESEDEYHTEGYQSVAPVCNDLLESPIQMFADGIARQFQWTSGNLDEPNGVEFGVNTHTDEKLYLDFLNRKSGYDFGLFGPKGHGKTTTASKILKGLQLVFGEDIFIGMIDPLREYYNLSVMSGGQHIIVGGPVGMNPWHMVPTPEEAIGLLEDDPYTQWEKKCMDFIEMFYGAENIDLSGKRGVWGKAITESALRYGITQDPKTHDPEYRAKRQEEYFGDPGDSIEEQAAHYIRRQERPDDVPHPDVDPRESPTPLTGIEIIDEMANDGTDFVRSPPDEEPSPRKVKEREDTAIDISNNDIESLLGGGEYSHFTKQMQVDFENVDTVYADLVHRESDSSIGLSMMVLYDLMYDHIKSIDKPGVIFIDEHHKMLRDDLVQESLNMKVRSGRHFDCIHGTSTQSFKDYFSEEDDSLTDNAEVLFDNMPVRIYQQDHITPEWLDDLDLTQDEADFIGECEPGDAHLGYSTALLWVKDKGTYPLQVTMERFGADAENPKEAVFIDHDIEDYGPDLLNYLNEDENTEWRFTPSQPKETTA